MTGQVIEVDRSDRRTRRRAATITARATAGARFTVTLTILSASLMTTAVLVKSPPPLTPLWLTITTTLVLYLTLLLIAWTTWPLVWAGAIYTSPTRGHRLLYLRTQHAEATVALRPAPRRHRLSPDDLEQRQAWAARTSG